MKDRVRAIGVLSRKSVFFVFQGVFFFLWRAGVSGALEGREGRGRERKEGAAAASSIPTSFARLLAHAFCFLSYEGVGWFGFAFFSLLLDGWLDWAGLGDWGKKKKGCRLAASFLSSFPQTPPSPPFYAKIMMFIFWHLAWVLFFFILWCVSCSHTHTFFVSFLLLSYPFFLSSNHASSLTLLCLAMVSLVVVFFLFFLFLSPIHRDLHDCIWFSPPPPLLSLSTMGSVRFCGIGIFLGKWGLEHLP